MTTTALLPAPPHNKLIQCSYYLLVRFFGLQGTKTHSKNFNQNRRKGREEGREKKEKKGKKVRCVRMNDFRDSRIQGSKIYPWGPLALHLYSLLSRCCLRTQADLPHAMAKIAISSSQRTPSPSQLTIPYWSRGWGIGGVGWGRALPLPC